MRCQGSCEKREILLGEFSCDMNGIRFAWREGSGKQSVVGISIWGSEDSILNPSIVAVVPINLSVFNSLVWDRCEMASRYLDS